MWLGLSACASHCFSSVFDMFLFIHIQHVAFLQYMVHTPKLAFLLKIGLRQQSPKTNIWLILSHLGSVRSLHNLLQIVELSY